MTEFSLTDGEWGAIYSLGTTTSAVVMLFAGVLSDRFRARSLAAVFLIFLSLSCIFMGLNRSLWALPLAIFALRFTGQGMLSHIAVVAISRWFSAARGKALAVSTLGFAFGEAALPLLFVSLLAFVSWRSLWVLAAVIPLAILPVLLILLRRERTPRSIARDDGAVGMHAKHWTRGDTLGHWLFWVLIPTMTAPGIFSTALFFQQVHLSATKGWDHAGFVALFPIYTLSAIASMFVFGIAVDRIGCRRLLAWYQIPLALSYLVFGLGSSLYSAALGFIFLGMMQGGGSTVFGAFWPEFYGSRNLGSIKALATALMVFGSALGPGITGLLIDYGYPFQDQMIGYSIYILAACGLTFVAMQRVKKELIAAA